MILFPQNMSYSNLRCSFFLFIPKSRVTQMSYSIYCVA